jgi:hypothetical protein
MKAKNKILNISVLVVFSTLFMLYSLSYGAQSSIQTKPSISAIKVLQTPLTLYEATTPSLSALIAATDRFHNAFSPMKFTDCPSDWYALEEVFYSGYKSYATNCAKKSYSVDDQKNAGCMGSDTVDQCTSKLFRQCLLRYEQDKTGWKNQPQGDLKTKIKKGIDKSNKIANEARELNDASKALLNLMP